MKTAGQSASSTVPRVRVLLRVISGARVRPRVTAAFSLVELMVTISIISLIGAILVPTLLHAKRRALATAVGNDLRVFAGAFDAYAHERGAWPAEVDAGVMPAEMTGRLDGTAWLRRTPIGGQYNWDNNQTHYGTNYKAVIAISSTSAAALVQDVDLFEMIDRAIDDGVLTTGNFRLGADDEPIFIVAQ